jgi:hypothetical protein
MSLEERKATQEQTAKKNARANWEFEFTDEEMGLISTISQSVDRPLPVNSHSKVNFYVIILLYSRLVLRPECRRCI